MPLEQFFLSRTETFKETTTKTFQNTTTETFKEVTTEIDHKIGAVEVNIKPECGSKAPHFILDVVRHFGRQADLRLRTVRSIAKMYWAILLTVPDCLFVGFATELGREMCHLLSFCTKP